MRLFLAHLHHRIPIYSDWLIGNVTAQSSLISTASITNGTTYSRQTTYGGYVYQNSVQYVSGYLTNGSSGVNHYLSVGKNGTNAVDGLIALLDVKILSSPPGAAKASLCVVPPCVCLCPAADDAIVLAGHRRLRGRHSSLPLRPSSYSPLRYSSRSLCLRSLVRFSPAPD